MGGCVGAAAEWGVACPPDRTLNAVESVVGFALLAPNHLMQVRHRGLQLPSLWRIHTAAVSWPRVSRLTAAIPMEKSTAAVHKLAVAYSCHPHGEISLQL